MLIHKLPQTPYTAFPLDWQVWAQENSLFCIQQMYFVMSDGPCWETKYYIADLESFPFMSPIHVCTSVFKFTWSQTPGWSGLCWWGFLQTGQIQTRQRLMEDANKKCGNIQYAANPIPQRARADEELTATCLVAEQWTVSKTDAASNTTGWVCLQD